MAIRAQAGFTYVAVMFAVAIAAIVATRAVESTMTDERRSKEDQLLYVGGLYRAAIQSYYTNSQGTEKVYPQRLEDLLDDPRTTTLRRHLRKLFRDPMTGNSEWGLVLTADDRIMGVYSLSTAKPLKVGGFAPELTSFAKAKTYQDWQFTYSANPP
jgi:type II secretory pathway pseudopilin PulG